MAEIPDWLFKDLMHCKRELEVRDGDFSYGSASELAEKRSIARKLSIPFTPPSKPGRSVNA